MTKNQVHEWHETRPEGGKHYFRAHFDGVRWKFSHTTPEDVDWPVIDEPELDVWEALRDVLFRKYQRKRLNYKLLESVDQILVRVRAGEVAQPAPKAEPQSDPKRGRFPQRRRGDR
ncbi:MAG: hypothetical protein JNM99_05535 [Verrucomicrobiaceae bacterium]|nr:hypothetical protein [Verrucomicrobiaceae bacterium]